MKKVLNALYTVICTLLLAAAVFFYSFALAENPEIAQKIICSISQKAADLGMKITPSHFEQVVQIDEEGEHQIVDVYFPVIWEETVEVIPETTEAE